MVIYDVKNFKNSDHLSLPKSLDLPEAERLSGIYKTFRNFGDYAKKAGKTFAKEAKFWASSLGEAVKESGYVPTNILPISLESGSAESNWQRFKNYASKHKIKTAAMIAIPVVHTAAKTIAYVGLAKDPTYLELFKLGETYAAAVLLPWHKPYIKTDPSKLDLNPKRALYPIEHPAVSYPVGLALDAIVDGIIYKI